MGYLRHPKIVKRPGSQLEFRIKKSRPHHVIRPCPENCNSPHAFRLSFFTYIRKKYVDSSSAITGLSEEKTDDEITTCFDKRLFFKASHTAEYYIIIQEILESLKVKDYLHDRIIRRIFSVVDCEYKRDKRRKTKKILRGLEVDLTSILTFLGDQDSVRELFEESMEELGTEHSEKGVHFVL